MREAFEMYAGGHRFGGEAEPFDGFQWHHDDAGF